MAICFPHLKMEIDHSLCIASKKLIQNLNLCVHELTFKMMTNLSIIATQSHMEYNSQSDREYALAHHQAPMRRRDAPRAHHQAQTRWPVAARKRDAPRVHQQARTRWPVAARVHHQTAMRWLEKARIHHQVPMRRWDAPRVHQQALTRWPVAAQVHHQALTRCSDVARVMTLNLKWWYKRITSENGILVSRERNRYD